MINLRIVIFFGFISHKIKHFFGEKSIFALQDFR